MNDLQEYVAERKKRGREFAEGYEVGYEQFKLGAFCGRLARRLV